MLTLDDVVDADLRLRSFKVVAKSFLERSYPEVTPDHLLFLVSMGRKEVALRRFTDDQRFVNSTTSTMVKAMVNHGLLLQTAAKLDRREALISWTAKAAEVVENFRKFWPKHPATKEISLAA